MPTAGYSLISIHLGIYQFEFAAIQAAICGLLQCQHEFTATNFTPKATMLPPQFTLGN